MIDLSEFCILYFIILLMANCSSSYYNHLYVFITLWISECVNTTVLHIKLRLRFNKSLGDNKLFDWRIRIRYYLNLLFSFLPICVTGLFFE